MEAIHFDVHTNSLWSSVPRSYFYNRPNEDIAAPEVARDSEWAYFCPLVQKQFPIIRFTSVSKRPAYNLILLPSTCCLQVYEAARLDEHSDNSLIHFETEREVHQCIRIDTVVKTAEVAKSR